MSTPKSPNFGFLIEHDETLVRLASLGELYARSDPNTSLLKIRQFAERMAKRTAARVGADVGAEDSFIEVLKTLGRERILDARVKDLFHQIRKSGNDAAHAFSGEIGGALHQLKLARQLAVWFHRTFGRRDFKPGPFLPPPDLEAESDELTAEVKQLRRANAEFRAREQGLEASEAELASLEQLVRDETAQQFAEAAADRDAALELAEQAEADNVALQKELDALRAAAESDDRDTRSEIEQTAAAAASEIDLDEVATRRLIDAQLRDYGWEADSSSLRYANGTRPEKGRNLAIAEWPTASGPADYVLFAGLKAIGVVEAKNSSLNVQGDIRQGERYAQSIKLPEDNQPDSGPWVDPSRASPITYRVPFVFATNGRAFLRQLLERSGVWFRDVRLPTNHSRPLDGWYSPEGLLDLLKQDTEAADQQLGDASADPLPLRDYQRSAVQAIESAIADRLRRILVAMATGTGKTRTCIALIYRLIKAGRFRRILFLVDRNTLGGQTVDALKTTPLDSRQAFAAIYGLAHNFQNHDPQPLESDTKLHIATVQSLVHELLEAEEGDGDPLPVDRYDCIVVDECHRGYNLDRELSEVELIVRDESDYVSKYRRVIDHFDAVHIGLTATPALHTTEIFGKPVFTYGYRQAVVEGWLSDYEPPHRIRTERSEEGIRFEEGEDLPLFDTATGLDLTEVADEVLEFDLAQFHRKVITEPWNRVVCQTLAEQIDPMSPGKVLVFAVDDAHADMVVRLLKQEFEETYGSVRDDAVVKITGRSDRPEALLRRFKNEHWPKVAVTVDLLTTGVDVPAIDTLVFLRRVRSRILFDQMIGRGTRLCPDLYGPGEDKKTFEIYDAVGVFENLLPLTEMKPVVTRPDVTFEQLVREMIEEPAIREQARDQLVAILRRKKLSEQQEEQLEAATGMDRETLVNHLVETPPDELAEWLVERPQFATILDAPSGGGGRQLAVSHHADQLLSIERGYGEGQRPEDYLEAFAEWVSTHGESVPALVVAAQRPSELTRADLKAIRLTLAEDGFTEAHLREAHRATTNQDIAATIIGHIRHVAAGQPLMNHADRVRRAVDEVLASQEWTKPQRQWLGRIGKQLEREVIVDREAFDAGEFRSQGGGFERLDRIFDGQLSQTVDDLMQFIWNVSI